MKKILTEPLLHFAVLGALLFIANGALSNSGSGDRGEIVITQGQIEHLAAGFARAWQRSPAPEELTGLIRDQVREEVLYREAIAIGLDQDDAIIRRRLRQKMEFISDDLAAQAEPTDAELNAYLQAHPDAFRIEPRYTFRQVYLNPQQRGNHLQRDAAQLLAQLNKQDAKTDSAQLGDALMLEPAYVANSLSDITKQFGARFAARLSELTLKQWQGLVDASPAFAVMADELKLNRHRFENCLKDDKTDLEIQKDRAEGNRLGIKSTPTYFINGKMVVGTKSLEDELKTHLEGKKN